MLIANLATIAINIIVSIRMSDISYQYEMSVWTIIISSVNCILDFVIIGSHIKIYIALKDIYKLSREHEIRIIKECVMEYVKRL